MTITKRRMINGVVALTVIFGGAATVAIPAYAASSDNAPRIQSNTNPSEQHSCRTMRCGPIVKDTAELIGLTPEAVMAQLHQGKSLVQIVKNTKGWSEEQYLAMLTVKATTKIDQIVSQGLLDKQKAEQIKAALPHKLKKAIHRNWKEQLPKRPGHPVNNHGHNNQVNWMR